MGMALDEPADDDKTWEIEGRKYCMAPDVEQQVVQGGGLVLDYIDDGMRKGYTISLASAAGGCSDTSCSSSGSCG
ncbi:hypothetical protein HN388_07975 [bacterium]|nr:hypothetical protein [bacterium]MBT4292090.1 hypothetical protein [bacterium]